MQRSNIAMVSALIFEQLPKTFPSLPLLLLCHNLQIKHYGWVIFQLQTFVSRWQSDGVRYVTSSLLTRSLESTIFYFLEQIKTKWVNAPQKTKEKKKKKVSLQNILF